MAFSANFHASWTGGRRVVLVRIDLATPSTRVIRLASEVMRAPVDGTYWEPILGPVEPIRAQASLLGQGPFLVGATFDIVGERMGWQPEGENLGHAFADYVWEGAKVEISLWERSIASYTDRGVVFKGTVNRIEASLRRARVHCIQPRRWNRKVPNRSINKLDYVDAPDGGAQPLPVIYGDHSARDLRLPWAQRPTATADQPYKSDWHRMGIARGVVPGFVVDKGVNTGIVKVLFASHALKTVQSASHNPLFVAQAGGQTGILGNLDWNAGCATVSSATEGGFTVTQDSLFAYTGVIPIEIRTRGTPGTTLRNILDYSNDISYGRLVTGQDAYLVLPSLGGGELIRGAYWMAHSGSAVNMTSWAHPVFTGALSATPKVTTLQIFNLWGADNLPGTGDDVPDAQRWTWEFGRGPESDNHVYGATDARVYLAGFQIYYRPQFEFISQPTVDFVVVEGFDPQGRRVSERVLTRGGGVARTKGVARPDSIRAFSAQFFGNVQGYADDVSGTYTGSASALIQNAADIARHLLVTYGGLPVFGVDATDGSSVDIGASSFGSFVAARSLMKLSDAQPWWLSVYIGTFTDVASVLSSIAAQSASMFYVDRFTGVLKWVFWGTTQGADYGRTIYARHLLDFSAELSSDTGLTNAVRVQYWQDYNLGRTLLETFVNKDGSSVGYVIPDVRDQKQIIDSTNNTLRWQHSGTGTTTYNLSLGSATYSGSTTVSGPMQLAAAIRSGMRGTLSTIHAGFGYHVVAGYNASVECNVNGTVRFAQVAAGRYATGQALVEAVVTALNGNGSGATFTGTYDDATNLFTIVCSQSWTILSRTATNTATVAWPMMGWYNDSTAGTSQTALQVSFAERFWIANTGVQTVTLKWATPGNSVAKTLGWLESADSNPGWLHHASQPRGDRESLAVNNTALYGDKGEVVIQAPWIREEVIAQRLRNVVLDFQSRPRVTVRLKVDHMPDVARGQTIAFDADVDRVTGFPRVDIAMNGTAAASAGTWAGKKFRVVEVVQNMGPTFDQEIVAVEV